MISLPGFFLFSTLLLCPVAVAQAPPTFIWDQLTPSQNLSWVECYSTFQCTRLEVPLDYSNASVGTAALAVIRLQANASSSEYRGPLIFNPGGPGASGVDTLVMLGQSLQVVFGDQYDIVSFDPRGVSYSTPVASFFETDAERALWNAGSVPTSLNASSDAIPHDWARARILGTLAAQRDPGILKYMTTDNAARDMLHITEKSGSEKLQYYGISYGSILGATFAALFPDKVGRILIDGVLDADAWFNGNLTIEATDTDKVLQTFFDSCAAAGPELCAFYAPTPAAIAERLAALTASIRTNPVPVVTPTAYGIVDYSLLRSALFTSFYVPYILFAPIAQGLAALEAGDGSILFSILQTAPPFACDCSADQVPFHLNNAEAVVAIQCGDGIEVTDSVEQLREFYKNAAKTSEFVEFLVGSGRVSCSGWQVYREDRFKAPVAAAKTSFPLLLLTTSVDPVAPKAAALKTLEGFPGSAIFTQDSPGHASITAPSLCTSTYFRAYFQNGTLPPPGTVCPVDATLFGAAPNTKRDEEDATVLAALKIIADVVRPVITRKFGAGF